MVSPWRTRKSPYFLFLFIPEVFSSLQKSLTLYASEMLGQGDGGCGRCRLVGRESTFHAQHVL